MRTNDEPAGNTERKPLRLWPGIVIVILQCLLRFVIPEILPGALGLGMIGGVLLGLAIVIWWAFFSRAPKIERWGAIVLITAALVAASFILHISIATANMGFMYIFYSIPVMCLAFVIWAVATRNLTDRTRRITMVAVILIASGSWGLLRTNGMDGESHQYFAWRWSKTAEERLLLQTGNKLLSALPDSAELNSEAAWPGFRGPNRDGIVHGEKINTDWVKSPPVEIWRNPVGPGCSSFAIHGKWFFTQEQRGDYEMVTCYDLNTGKLVWMHSDKARFWDSHSGAGPRSTPTISKGRVYTLGATGILNVLNERDGSVIWSRNAAQDTEVKLPGWGYSGSPLVTDSIVAVAVSGRIIAYDLLSGNKKWSGPDGGESYSSPQLLTLNGVRQILFMNKTNVTGFAPGDGRELWKVPMTGSPIIQPNHVNENEFIISEVSETGGQGIQLISVKNESGVWTTKELWKSNRFRPYFNDILVHKGHVYGFEGPVLTCADLEKGNRIWRGGRYGGQIILLADQDLILVLTEKGEVALVSATPDKFTELARIPAITGKTWNHPVLVGNILLVRNSQEMVAFKLSMSI